MHSYNRTFDLVRKMFMSQVSKLLNVFLSKKWLLVSIGCAIILQLSSSERSDWKLIPKTIIAIWFLMTLILSLTDIYNRLTFYIKFKTFKEAGVLSNEKLIINFLFLILFTTFFFVSITSIL